MNILSESFLLWIMTFPDIYNLSGYNTMYLLLFSNHRIAIDRMGEMEQVI